MLCMMLCMVYPFYMLNASISKPVHYKVNPKLVYQNDGTNHDILIHHCRCARRIDQAVNGALQLRLPIARRIDKATNFHNLLDNAIKDKVIPYCYLVIRMLPFFCRLYWLKRFRRK